MSDSDLDYESEDGFPPSSPVHKRASLPSDPDELRVHRIVAQEAARARLEEEHRQMKKRRRLDFRNEEAKLMAHFRRKYHCDHTMFRYGEFAFIPYIKKWSAPPARDANGNDIDLSSAETAKRSHEFVKMLDCEPLVKSRGETWLHVKPLYTETREWIVTYPGGHRYTLPKFSVPGMGRSAFMCASMPDFAKTYNDALGTRFSKCNARVPSIYATQMFGAHVFLHCHGRRRGEMPHVHLPAYAHIFKYNAALRREVAGLFRVLALLGAKHGVQLGSDRWDFVHTVLRQLLNCKGVFANKELACDLRRDCAEGRVPLGAFGRAKREELKATGEYNDSFWFDTDTEGDLER